MINKKLITSFILGVSAASIIATPALAKKSSKLEKCYGVVKAGQNDCSDLKNSHSCAGSAKVNGSPDEWMLLPKGSCNRIVGGTLVSKK